MGIPRFYRWLRDRYPLIRMDLTDENIQIPAIDNFYIDFNALIYRCIRQEGTFLRNKLQPLSIQQIYERVIEYLNYLFETIRPTKLLYIALDGVAPRAKINQSRDRRFKAVKDSQMFAEILNKSDIKNLQNFKNNSISPGTQFLVNLCAELKKMIMHKMETDWKHLNVFFSDCNYPGQGEHKIMDFLRYSKKENLFSQKTTHCIYSPDADVILLSLGMGLKYVCLIKQDTMQPQVSTGYAVQRWTEKPQFQIVMVNILAQYLQKQFYQCLKQIPGSGIADIISDFILLMAFVGNDFLPSQFCFTLKQGHMDQLYNSYKKYLVQNKQFIVKQGKINWQKVHKILQIATVFQANMLDSKIKSRKANKNNPQFQKLQQNQADQQLDLYEVIDQKITKGKQNYYKSRFNLKNIQHSNADPQFYKIIKSYIQGLQFYCTYYFLGLPSWNWYYPYHYTPLLVDVLQYIKHHKIEVKLNKSVPFDPFFALMFMLPEGSFNLLPSPIKNSLMQSQCPLRFPFDYYPKEFQLDKFQTIQYNKHALIPFLHQEKVRQVYNKIKVQEYTSAQKQRNKKSSISLFYTCVDENTGTYFSKGIQFGNNNQVLQQLKKLFLPILKATNEIKGERFPSLDIFGNWQLDKKTIITPHKFKYEGNMDAVFFNNFLGYVDNFEKCSEEMKAFINIQYEKIGIAGNCENYYIVKQAQYVRGPMKFNLIRSRRQVIVPDFALFKLPKYSYLPSQNPYQDKELYEKGERVTILNAQNFGAVGVIQQLRDKIVKVRITDYGYKLVSKPQQYDSQFYSINYVLNKFDITFAVLLKILDQITILPTFEKKIKILRDYIPNSINLGLSLISRNKIKIVPEFIRCQMQYENTQKPWTIFQTLELSQSCIELLEEYIDKFSWLVDYLQNNPELAMQRQVKINARQIFSQDQDYNVRLINQYQKLFELKYNGLFYSIYSKISNGVVGFQSRQKPQKIMVQLPYHEVISKRLAYLSPPPLKHQPQYHDIGDLVIYLKGLATGVITSIDDSMVYVYLAKKKKTIKINFKDAFNMKWLKIIEKQNAITWDMQTSYFTPTYWKKAIDSQK